MNVGNNSQQKILKRGFVGIKMVETIGWLLFKVVV